MHRTQLLSALVLASSLAACDGAPTPPAQREAAASTRASATAAPSNAPSSAPSATAPTTAPSPSSAPTAAPTADATAAPTASASASAAPARKLVPAATPGDEMPSVEAWDVLEREINVRASGEQKCSTKVLDGWFELKCGAAEGLVRAKYVEVVSGFDGSRALLEAEESQTLRWVAPLPASGERAQARLWGPKMHEIWLTLDHDEKGWKGALTGKKPED
jgi:hypothetical protein